jgi:hypothetical protein
MAAPLTQRTEEQQRLVIGFLWSGAGKLEKKYGTTSHEPVESLQMGEKISRQRTSGHGM